MRKQRDTQLNSRNGIVLAISQSPNSVEGDAPVTDYQRLAEALNAEIVGNVGHGKWLPFLHNLQKSTALDIGQAVYILRKYPNAQAYVSFSERIGIPLGMLLGGKRDRPAHVMIAHRLDTQAKRWLNKLGKWSAGVDKIITLCAAQLKYAERFMPHASVFIKASVTDELFYYPSNSAPEDYMLSVGNENRDYETLLKAVQGTNLNVKILSSSPWCRKKMSALFTCSDRVEFLPRVSYTALRELYQKAKMIVVPLNDVEYAAGQNGILEALCVNKPLVVSASRGIMDYVRHMQSAYVVPPHDADALAQALMTVYSDTALQRELISGARKTIEEYASLRVYTSRLESEISKAIEDRIT